MENGIKVKIEINSIDRMREFIEKLTLLAKEYDIELGTAKDTETNENFIAINVKDFIREEDIKMDIEK